MGSQRLATGHGLGALLRCGAVQCGAVKAGIVPDSTPRAPYLPAYDRILYVNKGIPAGAAPSYIAALPLPGLAVWFEIYLTFLLSLEDTGPDNRGRDKMLHEVPTRSCLPHGIDCTPDESTGVYSCTWVMRQSSCKLATPTGKLLDGVQCLSRLSGPVPGARLSNFTLHRATQVQHGLGARWARCLLPYRTVT